jgi:hypothetical protein
MEASASHKLNQGFNFFRNNHTVIVCAFLNLFWLESAKAFAQDFQALRFKTEVPVSLAIISPQRFNEFAVGFGNIGIIHVATEPTPQESTEVYSSGPGLSVQSEAMAEKNGNTTTDESNSVSHNLIYWGTHILAGMIGGTVYFAGWKLLHKAGRNGK